MLLAIAFVIFSHVRTHDPILKQIDGHEMPPPSSMSSSSTCFSTVADQLVAQLAAGVVAATTHDRPAESCRCPSGPEYFSRSRG